MRFFRPLLMRPNFFPPLESVHLPPMYETVLLLNMTLGLGIPEFDPMKLATLNTHPCTSGLLEQMGNFA